MQTFDVVFKNGIVVNHDGRIEADIGVKDGRITALGAFHAEQAGDVVDCSGLHILPGVIDSQVHFREPGLTHKEDLESGARAAVMGGVTGVFEMPNTNPTTTTLEALDAKLDAAKNRMHCNYAFFFGATPDNAKDCHEAEFVKGCSGIKIFMGSSTGTLLVESETALKDILKFGGKNRVSVHSEDEAMLRENKGLRVENDPSSHPVWRSVDVAMTSTTRLIRLAREVGRQVHVLHISTAQEIAFLQHHKDIASVELLPHHLTLTDEAYQRLGTLAQMNPPIRSKEHQNALWAGLRAGVVDVLGSDHAPHTLTEKNAAYPNSPSGMPGVQTLVPVMLDHVHKGRLTLERFVDLTSHGQQRLFRLARKGRIAVGYDADLTIVDLKAERTIHNSWIESKCRWTPYDGVSVTGWPVGTIISGQKVMWEDTLLLKGVGHPILTQQSLGVAH